MAIKIIKSPDVYLTAEAGARAGVMDLKQKARELLDGPFCKEVEQMLAQCVAEEREACAKIAEAEADRRTLSNWQRNTAKRIVEAIRARGKEE